MQKFNDLVLYFFHPSPGRSFEYYYFIGALIAILVVLAIVLHIYIKKMNREDKTFRKLFKRYPSRLWTLAVLFTLYLLIRYNFVPFFSMRFLLYILLGVTVYLGYQMINTYLKIYPEAKKLREKQHEQNRYRIKKKKSKKRK